MEMSEYCGLKLQPKPLNHGQRTPTANNGAA